MRFGSALFFATLLSAQDYSLLSVLRGDLLEWDANSLAVRLADHTVERCAYDQKTYFEKDRVRTTLPKFTAGQQVEVISDRTGSTLPCVARAVRVTRDAIVVERAAPLARLNASRTYRSAILDSIAPRGNLTFAGVVLKITPEAMLVRTRADGQKAFRLRQDTRYLQDGSPTANSALQPNVHVFVRAGKNFDEELEAYQVVWGEILTPQR